MKIDPAREFLPQLLEQIPLLQHMGITQCELGECELVLAASLAPNVNDKGTGFGGSLSALATLSGWALVTLALERELGRFDVVVRDSQMKYLKPVTADFSCRVSLPERASWEAFTARLRERGRARVALSIALYSGDLVACELEANYTALATS
ncbi:MAG: YiiD C-terminal domain-containing protein [Pseudomonadales bacterium]